MAKQEEHKVFVNSKGKIFNQDEGNFRTPKGKLEHMVDILFTLPVINSKLSNEELLPSIYVDENGDKHQFQKISPNSDQVIECVAYAHKKWKEKFPNKHRSIDDFSIEVHELLKRHRAGTNVREIKAKIDAYLNVLDLFVMQGKKDNVKKEKGYALNDERLYALEVLCPDFITHLTKLKEDGMHITEIGQIISYITNVNPVDAYKKTLTDDRSKRNIDKDFKLKIDQLKNRIDKVKG